MQEEIINGLLRNGVYMIPNFGKWELLPRRKGRTYCGTTNGDGIARYSKRVKFTSSLKLKDRICK